MAAIRRHRPLRLLLVLLIALAPILSATATPAHAMAEPGDQTVVMPCHSDPAELPAPVPAGGGTCPHCDDGHAMGTCECCTLAAPNAVPVPLVSAHSPSFDIVSIVPSGPLWFPAAPHHAPFRPPILPA
jgi:hypothetical protein